MHEATPLGLEARWTRRKWLGWALVALAPCVGAGLFFFHVVVDAGAAGGCGGG
jgi:hypothetical protein